MIGAENKIWHKEMETCGEEARGGWSWKSHCEDNLSKDLNDVWEPVMQISENLSCR